MSEFLKQFPASWIVLGTIISGVIFYVANRKVFAWQSAAVRLLAETNKETIASLERERNDYRTKLHLEKEAHHALSLENEHLKSLPNLGNIGDLLKDQSQIMRTIGSAFTEHSECDAKIFLKIDNSISLVQKSLALMNKRLSMKRKSVRN